MADGEPRSSRDIARELGWGLGATSQALRRAWEAGVVLRTVSPIYVTERRRRGRAGTATACKPVTVTIDAGSSIHAGGYYVVTYSGQWLGI